MNEGQEVLFVYKNELLTGMIWEIGPLDYLMKSKSVTGLFYISHSQVIKKKVGKEALEFIQEEKETSAL